MSTLCEECFSRKIFMGGWPLGMTVGTQARWLVRTAVRSAGRNLKARDKASKNMVTFTLIMGVWWLEEYVWHYSTGSWRLAPWAGPAPSWTGHKAGSFQVDPTSWWARRAQAHVAWCTGCRWSSYRVSAHKYRRAFVNSWNKERFSCTGLPQLGKTFAAYLTSANVTKPGSIGRVPELNTQMLLEMVGVQERLQSHE